MSHCAAAVPHFLHVLLHYGLRPSELILAGEGFFNLITSSSYRARTCRRQNHANYLLFTLPPASSASKSSILWLSAPE